MKNKIQKMFAVSMLCLSLSVSAFADCPETKPGDIPIPGCLVQSQPNNEKPDFINVIIKTMMDWF
jgi:hypothetical protein